MLDFNITPKINFRLMQMKSLALQFSKRKDHASVGVINQPTNTHPPKHFRDGQSSCQIHTCFGREVNTQSSDGIIGRIVIKFSYKKIIILHPQRELLHI